MTMATVEFEYRRGQRVYWYEYTDEGHELHTAVIESMAHGTDAAVCHRNPSGNEYTVSGGKSILECDIQTNAGGALRPQLPLQYKVPLTWVDECKKLETHDRTAQGAAT